MLLCERCGEVSQCHPLPSCHSIGRNPCKWVLFLWISHIFLKMSESGTIWCPLLGLYFTASWAIISISDTLSCSNCEEKGQNSQLAGPRSLKMLSSWMISTRQPVRGVFNLLFSFPSLNDCLLLLPPPHLPAAKKICQVLLELLSFNTQPAQPAHERWPTLTFTIIQLILAFCGNPTSLCWLALHHPQLLWYVNQNIKMLLLRRVAKL